MLLKTHLRRACVGVFIASCLLLTGCEYLYPEPEPVPDDKDLHFNPDYYSQNAKEYFSDGHYGKAKQQWQNQLKREQQLDLEGSWMARLGVASCNFYMGSLSIDGV